MKSANRASPARQTEIVVPLKRARERRGDELAFLPAALEIVETPPSPVGRLTVAIIILLFCSALIWSCWGTIDIVASATGKIVPSGRTKIIQPFETGVVRSIRVQDGQTVKAGDVLIELDPTVNAAERDHLAQRPPRRAAQHRAVARGARGRATIARPISRRPPARTRYWSAPSASSCSTRSPSTAPRSPRLARQQAQKEAEQATDRGHHPQARGDDSGRPAARRHPQDADGKGAEFEDHLFRDPAVAGRTAGGTQCPEEPSARKRRRRWRRFARRAARPWPNTGAPCRTNSPRPSRRRAGWPRT